MWTKELMGTDLYHLIFSFIIYSMLGWLVESLYMSYCNRELTNRGFGRGPFCPIYGFGALLGYYILSPLAGNMVMLYLCGAIVATLFEFLVAVLMQHFLGAVWWDYKEKPFNYKGVICLESTIAWGFYAIIIVKFLNGYVETQIARAPVESGILFCKLVIIAYGVDFMYHFLCAMGVNMKKQKERLVEQYQGFRTRF